MKNVVLYDAYNLIYRARHALPPKMQQSEWGITFAFFRSLAALNRQLKPDVAYFVTEGKPVHRLQLLPEYKGTRKHDNDDGFRRQRKEIINIVSQYLPVVTANHPEYECDDVIAHLAHFHAEQGDSVTVVSTDTDFLQLANSIDGYKQYNPVKKKYVDLPEHDYVAWKALVGDSSDNIEGFYGIGNKRALKMLADPQKLQEFLDTEEKVDKFELNTILISFARVSNPESMITFTTGNSQWGPLRDLFTDMNFKSLIGDRGWNNFVDAFGCLEEVNEAS